MKEPIIIAEIGNNHEGDFKMACMMLEHAVKAGADLVKFQAGTAEGFARTEKQVPYYKRFELTFKQYAELLHMGDELHTSVFFSIWSPEMEHLRNLESFHKIPARQCSTEEIEKHDSPRTFISIPVDLKHLRLPEAGMHGIPMHVVEQYPTFNPMLGRIPALWQLSQQGKAGYSDHTIGISSCITAVKEFKAVAIEKHFTLPLMRRDSHFRDHQHSATPDEFKKMVEILKGG